MLSLIFPTACELYAFHCNLEFSVTPRPLALMIEFGHGKAWIQMVSHKNGRAPPVRMVMRTHTLAQNCHCEFCCGMHLTCKKIPAPPDRNGSVKGPHKVEEATIAIASEVTAKLNKTRLRHPSMNEESVEKCLAGPGPGLSRSPYARTDCK